MSLRRIQGFDVALEHRPEGILGTVVDVPGVTATAGTRSEVLELIRDQLEPFWSRRRLDWARDQPKPCGLIKSTGRH